MDGNGTVNAPPRFILRQSLAMRKVESTLDHRIVACRHKSRNRPNRIHPVCMLGHSANMRWMMSGSAMKPDLEAACHAENSKPTAILPSARDRLGPVDLPAAFSAFFCAFDKTF